MPPRSRPLLLIACLVATLGAARAEASVVDHNVWETLVERASEIAVLECQQAGFGVARFRVVESWKGDLSVDQVVTFEHDALVGQRVLVLWGRHERPGPGVAPAYLPVSTRLHVCLVLTTHPVEWRRLRVDRGSGLVVDLPLDPERRLSGIRASHASVEDFRGAVRDFLAQPEAERERRVLLSLTHRFVGSARSPSLIADCEAAPDAASLVRRLLEKRALKQRVEIVISAGAGPLALAELARLPQDAPLLKQIQAARAEPFEPPRDLEAPERSLPPDLARSQLRRLAVDLALSAGAPWPSGPEPDLAEIEARVACGTRILREGGAPGEEEPSPSGYLQASRLCALYPGPRIPFLRRLLRAADPWARVAGATYLLLEARAEGLAALKQSVELPGEPGAWAALTLARHGAAEHVERLFELTGWEEAGAELQARTLVLLSNAASQASLPGPPNLPWRNRTQAQQGSLLTWWHAHKSRLAAHLADPWLAELTGQRVE